MAPEIVRKVRFAPYRRGTGTGPTYTLELLDPPASAGPTWDEAGRIRIGYRLKRHQAGKTTVLFEGFDCHAHCAIDSDTAVETVMTFLTLRPGDTDSDYFASYTPDQLDWAQSEAETLSCDVYDRFGAKGAR